MTNPTPHGQVPEALRLAEEISNLVCSSEAAAKTIAAAADELCRLHAENASLRAALAASPPPPAEQQATKETSGGFHVWRDISTAPKDGSRFVATGHNYGLYSEDRHACVAQWFRGCWMEASDWNETSELAYLTHWMPLPSPPDDVAAPAEQQAEPKAAPGDAIDEVMCERDEAEDFINELLDEVLGADRPEWSSAYNRYDAMDDVRERITALHKPAVDKAWCEFQSAMAAPQPAPAPLSGDVVKDAALWHWLAEYLVGTRTDLDDEIVASKTVNDLRKLVEAAIKQGGKA